MGRHHTDVAIFELEKEKIFRRAWHYACDVRDVRNPGDFFTSSTADVPVVIVRDHDGMLGGFVNVCIHRLNEVMQGSGNCKLMQCQYHGWAYNLDGSLHRAPGWTNRDDEENLGLVPISLEEWGPSVFVSLETDAASFRTTFADVLANIASTGVPVDLLSCRERREYEIHL